MTKFRNFTWQVFRCYDNDFVKCTIASCRQDFVKIADVYRLCYLQGGIFLRTCLLILLAYFV